MMFEMNEWMNGHQSQWPSPPSSIIIISFPTVVHRHYYHSPLTGIFSLSSSLMCSLLARSPPPSLEAGFMEPYSTADRYNPHDHHHHHHHKYGVRTVDQSGHSGWEHRSCTVIEAELASIAAERRLSTTEAVVRLLPIQNMYCCSR
jgi:hypothetical protein